jgi:hypothetical protein
MRLFSVPASGMKVIHSLVGLAMLAIAGLALALAPRLKVADEGPKISLEAMIPKQFGEWKLEKTIVSLMVSPELKAELDRIYNQLLTRNYINNKGDRIMLSIAYGDEQHRSMHVHRSEVCYAAQGFQLGSGQRGQCRAPSTLRADSPMRVGRLPFLWPFFNHIGQKQVWPIPTALLTATVFSRSKR